jgi:hypothetical protein
MTDNEKESSPPEEEVVKFDLEKVKANLPSYSSEKLCEMIVCDRYFSFSPEMGVLCMQELAARRATGDEFIFEDYIEQAYNQLPKITLNVPDLRATLTQMMKMSKK